MSEEKPKPFFEVPSFDQPGSPAVNHRGEKVYLSSETRGALEKIERQRRRATTPVRRGGMGRRVTAAGWT